MILPDRVRVQGLPSWGCNLSSTPCDTDLRQSGGRAAELRGRALAPVEGVDREDHADGDAGEEAGDGQAGEVGHQTDQGPRDEQGDGGRQEGAAPAEDVGENAGGHGGRERAQVRQGHDP